MIVPAAAPDELWRHAVGKYRGGADGVDGADGIIFDIMQCTCESIFCISTGFGRLLALVLLKI